MDDDFDNAESFAALQAAEQKFRSQSGTSGGSGTPTSSRPAAAGASASASASTSTTTTTTTTTTTAAAAAAAAAAPPGKVVQPKPQALPQRALASSILVSTRQKGNPMLTHISGVAWEYSDTPADYVMGATTCALFLSLKYHRLHPEYIYGRIRALAGRFTLRVLLCMVDIDNHEEPLRELAKTSLVNDLTLVLAWSAREAARYLEAYKALERATDGGSGIRGARAVTFAEQMSEFVTVPRGVNRTDAVSLVGNLGSVRAAVNAERDMLTAIPGWGEKKADRFLGTVNEPFRVGSTRARSGRHFDDTANEPLRIGMLKAREVSDIVGSRGTPDADEDEEVQDGRNRSYGTKRGRNTDVREDVPTWEPGEDEQEALFMAEDTRPEAPTEDGGAEVDTEQSAGRKKRQAEPELSEGVRAALAKLRNQ